MVNRDYTKEIGMDASPPTVPMPIAVAILSAIAVGAWLGFSSAHSASPEKTKIAAVHPAPAETFASK